MRFPIQKPPFPRYPVREWLGKYQSFWLCLKPRRHFVRFSNLLEKVFSDNPGYAGLEEFTQAWALDYWRWRLTHVKLSTVLLEMRAISGMWDYLINVQNLPLYNPARRATIKHIKEAAAKLESERCLAAKVNVASGNEGSPVVEDYSYLEFIAGIQ